MNDFVTTFKIYTSDTPSSWMFVFPEGEAKCGGALLPVILIFWSGETCLTVGFSEFL